jgi:ABC-type uncharacterized transport system fused permease/ATPase subunit
LVSSIDKVEKIINAPEQFLEVPKSQHFLSNHSLNFEIKHRNQKYFIEENTTQLLIMKNFKQSNHFVNILFGFQDSMEFQFTFDQYIYKLPDFIALRDNSLLLSINDFFAGNIYENLVLNHENISREMVYEMLKEVHLTSKLHQLRKGIDENIYMWDKVFDHSELVWLLLIRLKIMKPRLVVLNHILDGLEDEQLSEIASYLKTLQNSTLLILSYQSKISKFFDNLIEFKK